MATKQLNKETSKSEATNSSSLAESVPASPSTEAHEQQIAELRELTRSLMVSVQAMQGQNARNLELQDAIGDVKAATRAMLVAPAISSGYAGGHPAEQDCGCSECDCISERCCAFDIVMTHVRVVDMQIEPLDSNAFDMEVRMFASINGIGTEIPDHFGHLTLHKLINKPGVWSQVNRTINTVYVCKGEPKTFTITLDVLEIEEGIAEQVSALRDEYGTASQTMTLDCCCSTAPILSFEVHLTGGGQGGGTIEGKFTAVKKC
jgi:hypothetical protein